jgi:hypothetical protein
MTKRSNRNILEDNTINSLHEQILHMFTVITHAAINNMVSNETILSTFKDSLRFPFFKVAYKYTVFVYE